MEKQDINQETKNIDIKSIFYIFLRYIPLFLVSLIICLFISYLINRYSPRAYEVEGSLFIRDAMSGGGMDQLIPGAAAFRTTSLIHNEKTKLQARKLSEQVIKNLRFDVIYSGKGNVTNTELYKNSPILISIDSISDELYGNSFVVKILNNKEFTLKNGPDIKTYNFGQLIITKNGVFSIIKNNSVFSESKITGANENEFIIEFREPKAIANSYISRLNIKEVEPLSTIMRIKLTDAVPEKGQDYINALMTAYIQKNVEDKSSYATQTISFINDQLLKMAQTLTSAEDVLKDFKEEKGGISLSESTALSLSKLTSYDAEISRIEFEIRSLNFIKGYLSSEKQVELSAPSALQISDPQLISLLEQYNKLLQQKQELSQTFETSSPQIISINKAVETTKNLIASNIKSNLDGRAIQVKELKNRSDQIESQVKGLPSTEMQLLKLERNFNITQGIYQFLLQKRSEAEIAKAAITPDHEIINAAEYRTSPVSPDRTRNFYIAILLGITLPSIYIYLRKFLDDRIQSKAHLEKLTNIPIIGSVGHNNKKTNLVILNHPKSIISEAFRNIRTSIEYVGNNNESQSKVILISSVVGGEGKTFNAVNLASILAYAQKKVIILGLDLRKPKVHLDFDVENTQGLSTYLIGQAVLENVIKKTPIKNLDIITAGPIPPNPAELLLNDKIEILIEELKTRYDYVILDTPPIGLVTDAKILMKLSHVNLFIVREGYTKFDYIKLLNQTYADNNNSNMYIVINDINFKGNGYGYPCRCPC